MLWLKQSTAINVGLGPFLDSLDANTAETALTLTQPDIRLSKNGAAWAQKNAAQTLAHQENGWYSLALDATDTNTLGRLIVAVHETGALPVWKEFMVMPAGVYDAFITGSGGALVAGITGNITGNLSGSVGSVTGAGGSVTGATGSVTTVTDKTGYRLSSTGVADILTTTAMTEAYAADGATATLAQILYAIQQFMHERTVSGTTMTVKKLDGSTTAYTLTLNDGTDPTGLTRAT